MTVWHPKKGRLNINVSGSEAFIKKHNCKTADPDAKKEKKDEKK